MTPAPVKPTISPEVLNQIDIRVGTIESVSDVANSEKLVALPLRRILIRYAVILCCEAGIMKEL